MLQFSQPAILWGLLVLVIPILIHLFSRSKHKQVLFSTLAFFPEQLPINRKQIKLTQRRLLLLRLLLLAATVLLLSGPHITDRVTTAKSVHLLTPHWLANATQQQRTDLATQIRLSDDTEQSDLIALQSNQEISADMLLNREFQKPASAINVWYRVAQWIERYGTENQNIVVHATNRLSQFVGEPISIPASVRWSIIEPTTISNQFADAATLRVLLIDDNASNAKTVLSALETLNRADSISIEVLRSTLDDIKANKFDYVDATILFAGGLNSLDKRNTMGVIVEASDLVSLQGPDFPFLLAELLFQPIIDKHHWRNARVSAASVLNAGKGKLFFVEPTLDKPLELPIIWVVLCILLFAAERWFSEKLLMPSRASNPHD